MEDILAAVETIESDYEGNCRAAREIAREYFAAEKVLGKLMQPGLDFHNAMSAKRHLIVNADDFGLSAGVNRGIIRAHERAS